MRDESEIQQLIQIEAAKHSCLLLRNNSGALKDVHSGRLVRFGLGNVSEVQNRTVKSSDLIGITSLVVTQDMVGKLIGVMTAIEVKKEGWRWTASDREVAQRNFHELVISRGGIAGFASDVDSLRRLLGK